MITQETTAYFQAVEQAFNSRRDKGKDLAARERDLIEEWENQWIPLSVVITAINRCFDELDRHLRITDLHYC